MGLLYYIVCIAVTCLHVATSQRPVVTLPGMGTVKGITQTSTVNNNEFLTFRGIPFGKPPSGNLRFQPPEFAEPWDGELSARLWGRVCPQSCPLGAKARSSEQQSWQKLHEHFGDNVTFAEMHDDETDFEDCLNLNVFTRTTDINAKLPVMVYFHGGSFEFGSSIIYYPTHFMDHDMVLVVPHYRLGAIGFLSMQNEEIPGNAAMLDQVLALKWVNRFIEHFGGDPDQVTVFGESAGGASVSLLALSPLTKGLMKGIIAQSGSAFSEWAVDRNPVYNARGIAAEAGCDMSSDETINQCFMNSDVCTLLEAQDRWSDQERKRGKSGFGGCSPVVQTTGKEIFLPKFPEEIWADPDFVSVPAIYGANKHEGTYVVKLVYDDYYRPQGLLEDEYFMKYDALKPFFTMFDINDNARLVADAIEYEYIGVERMGNFTAMAPGLIDFGGATFLKAPTYESTKKHAAHGGKSYQYAFNFCGWSTIPVCIGIVGLEYPFPPGVCHAAEVVFLFGIPLTYTLLTEQEKILSQNMVKMWYNFAKYGDPTPIENPLGEDVPIWPAYDPENEYYLRIDKELEIRKDYAQEYTVAREENFGQHGFC